MHVCDLTENAHPPIGHWIVDWDRTGRCDYDDIDNVIETHRPVLQLSLGNLILERIRQEKSRRLDEMTYKQLAQAIDPNFLKQGIRARALRGVYYQGFGGPNTQSADFRDQRFTDTMIFKVTSSLHVWNGLDYLCLVKFMSWGDIGSDPDMTAREKALMLLWTSDIQLFCEDASFKYWGYQYILTQLGASIVPEDRYPKVRNPQLRGVVCKHLNRVLKSLPFHNGDITQEIILQFGGKLDDQTVQDIERTKQLQIEADQGLNRPTDVDQADQQQLDQIDQTMTPPAQPPSPMSPETPNANIPNNRSPDRRLPTDRGLQ